MKKATIKPRTADQILRALGVTKAREAEIVAMLKSAKKAKGPRSGRTLKQVAAAS